MASVSPGAILNIIPHALAPPSTTTTLSTTHHHHPPPHLYICMHSGSHEGGGLACVIVNIELAVGAGNCTLPLFLICPSSWSLWSLNEGNLPAHCFQFDCSPQQRACDCKAVIVFVSEVRLGMGSGCRDGSVVVVRRCDLVNTYCKQNRLLDETPISLLA